MKNIIPDRDLQLSIMSDKILGKENDNNHINNDNHLIPNNDLQNELEYNKIFNSREYYKGKSFNYVGEWTPGKFYRNDLLFQDFVSYEDKLLACVESHVSNNENGPNSIDKNILNQNVTFVNNFWSKIMSGHSPYPVLESDGIYYWYVDNNPLIVDGEKVRATGPKGDMPDMSDYYDRKTIEKKLTNKQNTISDIENIRSGADKGSTSVQRVKINGKESLPINGMVDLGTIEVNNHYTSEFTVTDLAKIIGTENNILVSKELIAAVENGKTLVIRNDSTSTAGIVTNSYVSTLGKYKFLIIDFNVNYVNIYSYHIEVAINDETYITSREITQTILQPQLTSGKTIKTINGNSILGDGNLQLGTTNITASQIFLEFRGDRSDGALMFTNKQGYEEHNREVCQRIVKNFSRTPNDEIFFVTINGIRNGFPYMETAILESKNVELVKATFVKGYLGEDSSAAAQLSTISIDASVLSNYAYGEESDFWWRYTSKDIPSVDDIGTGNESDVYVTEFTFDQITTKGTAVNVSPELVSAIYNNKIIVIPSKRGNFIATNIYSAPLDSNVDIRMQIPYGTYIYDVYLGAKGLAPQTVQTSANITRLLSGTLNTINGATLSRGVDMQLVSSISLNGKTYTPTKGAVDLGNIEGSGTYVTTLVYKATSKVENTRYPWSDATFGAPIIKHDYNDTTKEGVIYCSGRITTIGDLAFAGCSNLTSVTIGDSVTTIGWRAFSSCLSLKSVTIPDSVTTIGDYAFNECSSLTSVYCKATTPPVGGSDMFYNNASDLKIYVPMESVEAYKSAEYWCDYAEDIVGYHYDIGLFKTIFGKSIVGEGEAMDNYSMEITDAGTYTVESIINPRIMRGGNISPLVVDEFVQINFGPTLSVRISSDGTLTVSGDIGHIPTSYLASGVIPEEFMPYNVAKLDDIQQADFDESNVGSKAYIKNRSHYFSPYTSEQQLVVDDTTVGANIASITNYFKLGGSVYKSADMVGVEFNCQKSGAPVFVTVVEELDSDGNSIFYLRHISGNSSAGAPIMFCPAGDVKTIDDAYIPNGVARTKDLNVRNVCIVDTEAEIDDTISFATTEYVDTAISAAITTTLNTPV